jgi:DNA-binding NtrC family response regulator
VDDIPQLVDWIVSRIQRRLGKQIQTIPNDMMEELTTYAWPGNVRELENVIERAIIFSEGNTLQLASPLRKTTSTKKPSPSSAPIKSLAEMEKEHILRALDTTLWNISGKGGAADLLGINPSTLRGRMRKHGIRRPSIRS